MEALINLLLEMGSPGPIDYEAFLKSTGQSYGIVLVEKKVSFALRNPETSPPIATILLQEGFGKDWVTDRIELPNTFTEDTCRFGSEPLGNSILAVYPTFEATDHPMKAWRIKDAKFHSIDPNQVTCNYDRDFAHNHHHHH